MVAQLDWPVVLTTARRLRRGGEGGYPGLGLAANPRHRTRARPPRSRSGQSPRRPVAVFHGEEPNTKVMTSSMICLTGLWDQSRFARTVGARSFATASGAPLADCSHAPLGGGPPRVTKCVHTHLKQDSTITPVNA